MSFTPDPSIVRCCFWFLSCGRYLCPYPYTIVVTRASRCTHDRNGDSYTAELLRSGQVHHAHQCTLFAVLLMSSFFRLSPHHMPRGGLTTANNQSIYMHACNQAAALTRAATVLPCSLPASLQSPHARGQQDRMNPHKHNSLHNCMGYHQSHHVVLEAASFCLYFLNLILAARRIKRKSAPQAAFPISLHTYVRAPQQSAQHQYSR